MSKKLRNQVWRHPRMGDPALKLTLLALAELADDTGLVSPGHAEVAVMAAIEVETLSAHIRLLEQFGYLSVIERARGRGSRNTYQLHFQEGQTVDRRSKKTPCSTGGFIENKPPVQRGVLLEENPLFNGGFSEKKPPVQGGVLGKETPCSTGGFPEINPLFNGGFSEVANKDTREKGCSKSIENTLTLTDDDEEEEHNTSHCSPTSFSSSSSPSSSSSNSSVFSQAAKYQPIYEAICRVCGFEDAHSISRNNLTEITNTLQWLLTNVTGSPDAIAQEIVSNFSMPPNGPWDKSNPPWPSQIRFDWKRMQMKVASAAAGNLPTGGKNGANSRNGRGLSGISAFSDGVRSTRRGANRETGAGAASE